MPGSPSIEAVDLARRFGEAWALDGLSLDAEPGEVIALLGPNGAGKTTTVRILDGILDPHRGHARVLGLDPRVSGTELRRRTGVLTEAGGLDDRLTLTENLLTHARIRAIPAPEARRCAGELLERFGMSAQADRPAQGLSTGERKRVALARALLHRPEVLFLDEPTSGLDPAATRDVLSLIAGLAGSDGATVVLCTHFLAEAERLCRRVAILETGRLLAFGSPAELAAELWSGLPVGLRGHPEPLEQLAGSPAGLGGGDAADAGVGEQVLGQREAIVQAPRLGQHAGPAPQLGPRHHGIEPQHASVAAVRIEDSVEDAHGRGLAGAVGPEEGDHLPRLGVEAQAVEGPRLAEPPGQIDGLDRGATRHRPPIDATRERPEPGR